jgi:protein-S-isoprenylcysteine O-methyltransferase Ste14
MKLDALELAFFAGWVAYIAIRGVYEGRASKAPRVQDARRADLPWLLPVAVGSLVLPLLHALTPWLTRFDSEQAFAIRVAGVPLLIAGLRLFQRAHADLGCWWSATLEIREAQPLITQGVYARIRHPMYLAILLISTAQGLLLRNTLAGWGALVAFSLLLWVRLPREERMLAQQFGAAWSDYCARTGRLLPRWRR